MASLSDILQQSLVDSTTARSQAELALKNWENANFPGYLEALIGELANEAKPPQIRQLAGILLKNAVGGGPSGSGQGAISGDSGASIHSKAAAATSSLRVQMLQQRWMGLDERVRDAIKSGLLTILASPHHTARSTAAYAVAKIAAIEIPRAQWLPLVDILVNNIISANSTPYLKQSSFETLGFVCEEVPPKNLSQKSGTILHAISLGMRVEETDDNIKLAATLALANSMEFVEENFKVETQRNLIMQMIFTAATYEKHEKVRAAGFQCLVEVADHYYEFLSGYMHVIYALTSKAIENDLTPDIQLQAVEFWNAICDNEMNIHEEIEDAKDNNVNLNECRPCYDFIKKALPQLMPILLASLTKQPESMDDDEWNVPTAAGTCIGLCAQTAQDDIVPYVMPFVQQNVGNTDWRFREASLLAFGAILDGPDHDKLVEMVAPAFLVILGSLNDPHIAVRDTCAWAIGRICNLIPETIDEQKLPHLMNAFTKGLQDEPKIAANVCWAVHNLAATIDPTQLADSTPLSPFYAPLMIHLIQCTTRPDAVQANLLSAAYEAVNVLIGAASQKEYNVIGELLAPLIQRLQQSTVTSLEDREKQNQIQALICAALQVIIQKLDERALAQPADSLMYTFLEVLRTKGSAATVHEETLMAIGSLAGKCGKQFEKYIGQLNTFLMHGLQNYQETPVCTVTVGLVGDIARAIEERFQQLGDPIMTILLHHLENQDVERSIKPHIFSCFGDIALAVSGYFERYLTHVLGFLRGASAFTFDNEEAQNEDSVDYLLQLRESVAEAYTGILQGLAAENKQHVFLGPNNSTLATIRDFFDLIRKEEIDDPRVLRAVVGLVGDIASRLPREHAIAIRTDSVKWIIETALQAGPGSQDDEKNLSQTQKAAMWAREATFEAFGH